MLPIPARFFAAALAVSSLLGGCRSSSTNVTGPSSSKCAITLSGSTQVPAAGATSTVGIATGRECTWTASSQAAWIAVNPTSGQGAATLTLTAQANPDPATRRGALVVNEARIEFQQDAAACRFAIAPETAAAPAAGASLTFTVTTTPTCAWTASSAVPWLTPQGDARGTGSATFAVLVGANGGSARTGTVSAGGATATVAQAAAAGPCQYSVSASPASFAPSGGSGTLSIATNQPSCSWTASPNVPWITIGGSTSGVGPATVPFSVQANGGGARAGAIGVASESVAITQTGTSACTFGVTPSSRSVAAGGGADAFDVDTAAGCAWNAVSNVAWITVTGGASGSGSGRVTFSAAANQGAARTGTLAIAGTVVSVTQPATACTFSVVPESASVARTGGTASFNVTTQGGCAWTATSPDAWITITGGASGTGSGIASIAVAANGGGARTSTLTIAGQAVAVMQEGNACTYSLAPTGLSAGATGGANSVAVTAPAGCAWTASSNDAWLAITAGAVGNGGGTVSFTVAPNTGAARNGTLTIANIPFVVSQAAVVPTCSYSIQPTSASIGAQASSIPVALTTQAGCTWTVASNAPWLSASGAAAGTGSATVTIAAEANAATLARTGTATIGGQTLTVTQAASSCTYAVAPTTVTSPAASGSFPVEVTTTAGCAWTAASHDSWITIASGSSGSGSGSVSLAVSANTSTQARTGTLTVAGTPVTVNQAGAACVFGVSPTSIAAPATQSTAFVDVTTAAGCAWVSSTSDAWITITPPSSGTGNGRVNVTILANTTGSPRQGRLVVAGQQVDIQQQ